MEEIITNELIAYKSGFISGKHNVLELLMTNNIDAIELASDDLQEDNWFSYGYQDCLQYFLNSYLQNKMIAPKLLAQETFQEILRECFTKRVLQYNQENNTAISVTKYKLER